MSNGRKRLSWEETALKLAFNIADYRSEDPHVTVGAVIIKHDNSLLLGYNGAPPGINIDWTNRDQRRDRVIHAEQNVLSEVKTGEVKILAVTHLPCKDCIKIIARKAIKKVIYCFELENYDNDLVKKLASEFNIQLQRLSV